MFKVISGGVCIEYTAKFSEVIEAKKGARKDLQVWYVFPNGQAKRLQ